MTNTLNNFDPHSVYLILGHTNHFIAIEMVFFQPFIPICNNKLIL